MSEKTFHIGDTVTWAYPDMDFTQQSLVVRYGHGPWTVSEIRNVPERPGRTLLLHPQQLELADESGRVRVPSISGWWLNKA